MSHPYSVNQVELLDVLGQGPGDNQGDVGARPTLIVAQLELCRILGDKAIRRRGLPAFE